MGDRYYSQQSGGQIIVNPSAFTGDVTLTGYEASYILANTTGGSFTITLPKASLFPSKIYYFSVQTGNDGNSLYVAGNTGDTIQVQGDNFGSSIQLQTNAGGYGVISGGAAGVWYLLQSPLWSPFYGNNFAATLIIDGDGDPQAISPQDLLADTGPVSNAVFGSSSSGDPAWSFGFLAINPTIWTDGDYTFTGIEPSYNLLDTSSGIVTINLPSGTDGKVYFFNMLAGVLEGVIQTQNSDLFQDGTDVQFMAPGSVLGVMYSATNQIWYFLNNSQREDINTYTAAEDITAGNLVNVEGIGGTAEIRKASATSGYRAQGFALADISMGNSGPVNVGAGVITGFSLLTPGAIYFLGDSGGITLSVPGSGKLLQQVGYAETAAILQFWPGTVTQR